MADTIVQKKLSRLIQEELGEILTKAFQGTSGKILTISQVKVTRDLSLAKVYVSVFPDRELEPAIEGLNESGWQYRHQLAGKLRNKVRKIPELRFYADDSFAEADRINRLLDRLDIPPATEEDEATD